MLSQDEIAEAAGPILFLAQRARLAALRAAAEHIPISQETEADLDRLLAETEGTTQALLMQSRTPDVEYFDDLFDDDFLDLCSTLRVNLVAGINQPQIWLRFRDPDAILSRWMESRADNDAIAEDNTTPVFSQQVATVEAAVRAAFSALKENNSI